VWTSGRLPADHWIRQRDANTRRTRVRLAYPHDDSMLAIQVRDAALHSPHRPSPLGGMERASGNAAGGARDDEARDELEEAAEAE
jgi:hypothetical protein